MSTSDPEGGEPSGAEEPAPLDVDSAFAAIVAGWSNDSGPASWPDQENLTPEKTDDRPDDTPPTDPVGIVGLSANEPLLPQIGPPPEPVEEEPEPFVPPDPPPIPRGDLFTTLAWAGVIVGPLFLLVAVIAWRTAPQMYILAALVAFVGGFVVLVSRMPKHRDDDDDDGAVV